MNSDGSRAPWICFMDVCTVHVSHEFLALHVDACPNPARLRATQHHGRCARPLDRAYMRQFKAALGRVLVTLRWYITHSMRRLIMRWTHDAVKEIATMRHNTAAWSDIVCSPTEQSAVLALATARQHRKHALQASPRPPRSSSAQMPMWKMWAAVWWTKTHQTFSQNSSKKRTTSPNCLSMRSQSRRMCTRRRPSQHFASSTVTVCAAYRASDKKKSSAITRCLPGPGQPRNPGSAGGQERYRKSSARNPHQQLPAQSHSHPFFRSLP